jgi:hypothetical protein
MNTYKAEVNKIILALISVGLLILLIFPASLSAGHFRSGTMSWKLADNDNDTIIIYMSNGWTLDHGCCRGSSVDDIKSNYTDFLPTLYWEKDGSPNTGATLDFKVFSVDSVADHILTNMGDSSSGWEKGLSHDYDNGTYIIYWKGFARSAVVNKEDGYSTDGGTSSGNSNRWRSETMVRIGGDYAGNVSPVSFVPPIVKVQDNASFSYQLVATDENGDNLTYRWGYLREFFIEDGTGDDTTFTMPTGMTLTPSGLIKWDIRDNVTCTGCSTNDDAVDNTTNKLWVAVIMVEDRLDNGTAKSKIPIDFFFQVTSADNNPPEITGIYDFTVSVGSTKNFSFTTTDYSEVAPTVTIVNDPPSDNDSIWDTASTTAMVNGDNTTTFTITFTPDSSMGDTSYVISIRSTDNVGMTRDQSFSIQVSSVANADPTAPILLSPADGDNVTSPVTFRFAGSTDPDGDTVSYLLKVCGSSDFVGCAGTSVTAGGNFVPPFNQNFHDKLIPWPNPLYAATSSQQFSQDFSMMPKWFIMLVMLGLLSVIISLSVKNITHRRIVFVLFWLIIGMASCMSSSSNEDELDEENKTDNTTTSTDTTAPTVSSVSTTADNQSSVSITDNIIVTFSEAMGTTHVTTNTDNTSCSGTLRVSSDNFSTCVKMSSSSPASSNSNKTFTLDPYDNLAVLTTYLTRVTTGVKDTAGNAMSSEYETSSGFTTDNGSSSIIPTVSSVSTTSDNQSLVSIYYDNITVTFSKAMDTFYVTTNTSDSYCTGTIRVSSSSDNFSTGNCVKMSSAPASSNSSRTFTLDPYDNLTRLTTYLTRVTTGVKDTYGNAISSQYESSSGFTTDNGSIIVPNSSLTSGIYYWRVEATDPKGGSALSETWSFTVQ